MEHYKEKLSAFVNHELTNDERQTIAEHLLLCAECRAEHDQIKFGAALADHLTPMNAPENLWKRIETSLNEKEEIRSVMPFFAFLNFRIFAVSLSIFLVLAAALYLIFFQSKSSETVRNEMQKTENLQNLPAEKKPASNEDQSAENKISEPDILNKNPSNTDIKEPKLAQNTIENPVESRKSSPLKNEKARKGISPVKSGSASWNVEILAGMPKIGNSFENEKIAVGEYLETDENSKAKIQVANIGNVEIAPNSRVKFVKTKPTEHRLSLEKGELKAKIFAPPRLFIVDTPSAAAVDLGCEYTLEVDEKGDSRLHVTGGFVALENGRFSSIVPAGAIALTKKGKGIGTPFAEDSTSELKNALYKFDFENGGNAALEIIIKESDLYDSITLWHLLLKTQKPERERVFDALKDKVALPENVTREEILKLNKKMLEAWWQEIENIWFG